MSMKKMLALLLALAMVLALAACGESGAKDNDKNNDAKAPAANQEKEPAGDTNKDPEKNPEPSKDSATVPSEDAPVTENPDVDEPEIDAPVVDNPVEGNPVERPMPGLTETPSAITEFVNGEDAKEFAELFAEDRDCTTTIEAIGTGFVITICINDMDDVSEEEKAAIQAIYDELGALLSESLPEMQEELEGLTYFCVNVCDKDGDFIASLYVGE